MPLLEADTIGKAYRGRPVLTTASLRAYPGAVTALCGRNGAGKSTLLAIAAGWRQADTGVVRFDGVTWVRPSLPLLAERGVFYLPDRAILSPASATEYTPKDHLNRCPRVPLEGRGPPASSSTRVAPAWSTA